MMTAKNDRQKDEVFSKSVRAGKRTYFFDVKRTASGEHYLTITESKRKFNNDDGIFLYEKYKIFLYKEDFEKFKDALECATSFVREKNIENNISDVEREEPETDSLSNQHIDFEFEDL